MDNGNSNNEEKMDESDKNKFIIFYLANEAYGAKLQEVREVVEEAPMKTVPNTIESFKGVFNLRGQIVGVVDLKTRFHIKDAAKQRSVLLVFETDSGAISAAVDSIGTVVEIPEDHVEKRPNIVSPISTKYILGIAKHEGRLVTLLDLKSILSQEELKEVAHSKMQLKAS